MMPDPTRTPGAPEPLQIAVEDRGSTVVLKVAGMAAVEVAGQLSRALQEAANRAPRLLLVDLSGLSFISSTGLGGLVAAHVTCEKNNTRLCLVNPRPFIREILEVTKLSTLFKIVDDPEEAEQQFRAG